MDEEFCELPPPADWRQVRIGWDTLWVSSDGYIKTVDGIMGSTAGMAVPGTPYRSYPVRVAEDRTVLVYVHELVWFAFHGMPPDGWHVGHRAMAENRLDNLELYTGGAVALRALARA